MEGFIGFTPGSFFCPRMRGQIDEERESYSWPSDCSTYPYSVTMSNDATVCW